VLSILNNIDLESASKKALSCIIIKFASVIFLTLRFVKAEHLMAISVLLNNARSMPGNNFVSNGDDINKLQGFYMKMWMLSYMKNISQFNKIHTSFTQLFYI